MTFEHLVHTTSEWLREGPASGIVVSSRIRLARNLAAYPFVHRANPEQLTEIESTLQASTEDTPDFARGLFVRMNSLPALDRGFLQERRLISQMLAGQEVVGAVVIPEEGNCSVMVNEEDHLRLQALLPGFQLPEAHRIADRIDDELGKRMEFAFSEELGFLTACPTNAGTGMRASVLVHLPVLAVTKQIDAAFRSVSQVGLHVRGMYGEGSDIVGNFFQISNQATLGRSEEDIVRSLEGVTRQIMEHEERAREALREGANSELQDKIWRAYGTLKHARLLTSEEVINLTSPLRLGVSMGIVDCVDLATLNELLVYTRPAHLQKAAEREMEAEERDYYRAAYVRERLR